MCKGRGEEENGKLQLGPLAIVSCELCDSEASLYCQADDAFLCRKCDVWVHDANFLARRHIRCLLCGVCRSLTQRYLIGAASEVVLPTIVAERSSATLVRRKGNSNEQSLTDSTTTMRIKKPFLFL